MVPAGRDLERVVKRVLVLGAYGHIGSHVARGLVADGHDVVALGRDAASARRVLPGFRWIFKDLRDLTNPVDWLPILADVDIVVNCAGALQVNLKDSLVAVHLHAIGALVFACEKADVGLIHFSASGVNNPANSDLAFFRTKAEGEALIRESSTEWWIFRPGLVLAQSAMGATATLRLQASVPYVLFMASGETPIQTISMDDVVLAVRRAVNADVPPQTEADLVEAQSHELQNVVLGMRRWLGFEAPRKIVNLPVYAVRMFTRLADMASWLGWRAPYRTTAIDVLVRGTRGNAQQTRAVLGRPAHSMASTFLTLRAGLEERLRARLDMLTPFVFITLALHWIVAGIIAVTNVETGIEYLEDGGHAELLSASITWLLAAVTLALGVSLLVRRWAKRALVAMALFSGLYLAGATIALPELWFDPLGPLVKVFPIIVVTLIARVLIDNR